jgi:hypothetical protein
MLDRAKWTDKFFVKKEGDKGAATYALKTPEQVHNLLALLVHAYKYSQEEGDKGAASYALKTPEQVQKYKYWRIY